MGPTEVAACQPLVVKVHVPEILAAAPQPEFAAPLLIKGTRPPLRLDMIGAEPAFSEDGIPRLPSRPARLPTATP